MKELITDLTQLSEPCEPFIFLDENGKVIEESKAELETVIADLKEVLTANSEMTAIAAPQIGINKRVFCIKFNDVIKTFINPIITRKKDMKIIPETFDSIPGKEILISRPDEVKVVYYNDNFKYEDNKLLGGAAYKFDQMAQLLDGITPDILGLVSDPETDGKLAELPEEEMAEVVEFYKNYVSTKLASLKESIKANEDLAKQYNKLKFSEDVINDRTQVVDEEGDERRAKVQRRTNYQLSKQAKNIHQKELSQVANKSRRKR